MAQVLIRAGFKDVHALHGGLEAWQSAGGAVEPKDATAEIRPRDEQRQDEGRRA